MTLGIFKTVIAIKNKYILENTMRSVFEAEGNESNRTPTPTTHAIRKIMETNCSRHPESKASLIKLPGCKGGGLLFMDLTHRNFNVNFGRFEHTSELADRGLKNCIYCG